MEASYNHGIIDNNLLLYTILCIYLSDPLFLFFFVQSPVSVLLHFIIPECISTRLRMVHLFSQCCTRVSVTIEFNVDFIAMGALSSRL